MLIEFEDIELLHNIDLNDVSYNKYKNDAYWSIVYYSLYKVLFIIMLIIVLVSMFMRLYLLRFMLLGVLIYGCVTHKSRMQKNYKNVIDYYAYVETFYPQRIL